MNDRPFETEPFRQALLERRRTLQAQQGSDADAVVELDQTRQGRLSRMDAMQQQAMAAETARRRALELTRIDAALARVDSGDFGLCVRCDEEIAPRRLEIDPAATLCIGCADQAES
jgi:DnaK suppressor protein